MASIIKRGKHFRAGVRWSGTHRHRRFAEPRETEACAAVVVQSADEIAAHGYLHQRLRTSPSDWCI